MQKTTFRINKMDCPSEEQLIRLKLDSMPNIKSLQFDIQNRQLSVIHSENSRKILSLLETLQLETSILSEETIESDVTTSKNQKIERKTLAIVLLINTAFFAIEFITGFIANSMGLVADSMDMLADGIVYGLALGAVGGTIIRKKNTAKIAGYFQIILAIAGLTEVIRRFIGTEKMPDFKTMIIVSILALAANTICLYLLQKNNNREAHMQASMIFTSNDVIINAGVIVAAILVKAFDSGYPDLIAGSIVFAIVARGAYRILQLSK